MERDTLRISSLPLLQCCPTLFLLRRAGQEIEEATPDDPPVGKVTRELSDALRRIDP